ncbi:hypothetical protein COLO4_04498 [Corchorus olitorius]|uniref:Uncharacterized protein n=1 Tax=Corchorus olitorius TaxID=93759 RepID=A0A1R3KTM8_9ROSI|nr:hypothetical protein COLO4_04498 [Corchorus olitorius]
MTSLRIPFSLLTMVLDKILAIRVLFSSLRRYPPFKNAKDAWVVKSPTTCQNF